MQQDRLFTFVLGRAPDGGKLSLKCRLSTAIYYGWFDALVRPDRNPGVSMDDWSAVATWTARTVDCYGGRRLRICRSRIRKGHPAGLTNAFRVSRDATLKELAYLASITRPEFGWMESLDGRRVFREEWLERHAANQLP